MIKVALAVSLVLLVVFAGSVAYGLTAFNKEVAGLGNVTYLDEVRVVEFGFVTPSEVRVLLMSTEDTVPDHVYKVIFYVNAGLQRAEGPMAWASDEIPGESKVMRFSKIKPLGISSIGVEVVK